MRRTATALLVPLLLSGCAPRPGPAAQRSSLLRLVTEPRTLTLCEGMTRHVGVSASWAGSARPDVSGLPRITWLSRDAGVVRVDSLTGRITGMRAGAAAVIVHGRMAGEYGRATLPVTVLAGEWDENGSRESGRLVCRRD